MRDRTVVAVCVVALVLVGAFALATAPDDDTPEQSAGSDATPVSTPPPTTAASGDSADSTTGTARPAPFGFVITETEPCGQTCRDVTVALTNNRASTATNVSVSTRIFAGNDTDDGQVWEGREDVGTLAAGETVTSTRRVELGFGGALTVRNSDGWVTIETTVSSAEETTTFTRTEQVG
ncbi:hypothetical protein [Salinigranum sp. GCM10025319]|uniref:hypothetical protein n=1 Tax=Salinigranum sp. GCM10025319 TaxID=3252687 RepID=UPI00360DF2FB